MEHADCLQLLLQFTKALSHRVRTPLSVVTNDLHYLESLVGAGECERAIRKCHDISSLFNVTQKLYSLSPEKSQVNAVEIFKKSGVNITATAPATLRASADYLEFLGGWLNALFPDTLAELRTGSDGSWKISFSGTSPSYKELLEVDSLSRSVFEVCCAGCGINATFADAGLVLQPFTECHV